jgi:hypothetical protein
MNTTRHRLYLNENLCCMPNDFSRHVSARSNDRTLNSTNLVSAVHLHTSGHQWVTSLVEFHTKIYQNFLTRRGEELFDDWSGTDFVSH